MAAIVCASLPAQEGEVECTLQATIHINPVTAPIAELAVAFG